MREPTKKQLERAAEVIEKMRVELVRECPFYPSLANIMEDYVVRCVRLAKQAKR